MHADMLDIKYRVDESSKEPRLGSGRISASELQNEAELELPHTTYIYLQIVMAIVNH
jgi:hypothetical protein